MKNNSVTKYRRRQGRKVKCSQCNGTGTGNSFCTCKVCMGNGWVLR